MRGAEPLSAKRLAAVTRGCRALNVAIIAAFLIYGVVAYIAGSGEPVLAAMWAFIFGLALTISGKRA